ncbi:MAG: hypothetical protein V4710_11400, partial [Verrucomicrobiota bacterium]
MKTSAGATEFPAAQSAVAVQPVRNSIALAFLNICLALTMFVIVCRVINGLLPRQPVPIVSEKLAYFARHRDEYDTLFIGSSRVYRQIDPALFDQVTREAGVPTRSFNLGIDSMFSPEDS